jgi:hypothetical protein
MNLAEICKIDGRRDLVQAEDRREMMRGAGVKRPAPLSVVAVADHQTSKRVHHINAVTSALPPLPLRHPQPTAHHHQQLHLQPHEQQQRASAVAGGVGSESLHSEDDADEDGLDWAFIVQQMDAAATPHPHHEEEELLPSCPIVISDDGGCGGDGLHNLEEGSSSSLLLGADISESAWLDQDHQPDTSAAGEDEDEDEDGAGEEGEEEGSLWGLPPAVADILGQRGITQFYGILWYYLFKMINIYFIFLIFILVLPYFLYFLAIFIFKLRYYLVN